MINNLDQVAVQTLIWLGVPFLIIVALHFGIIALDRIQSRIFIFKRPLPLKSKIRFPLISGAVFTWGHIYSVKIQHDITSWTEPLFRILMIISATWLLIRLIDLFVMWALQRIDIGKKDNLRARAFVTQISYFQRAIYFLLSCIALAVILMGFESVRTIGTSLIASAGLAGIILGFAAQRSIANLIAGFQIAYTQPIRVDDVIVIENEFGRVEEITLTYVVLRLWDLRRIVVPISYFLENPFQNWTRTSSQILGSVELYLDYTAPIQLLREHFHQIVSSSEKWDRSVNVFQVTDATERTIKVRGLLSAEDASTAWDLRCEVREKLVKVIQERYPHALPQNRFTEIGPTPLQTT